MDPVPAVALEASSVFPPVQNEAVPVIFAEGEAISVTVKASDVNEQSLLLVTVTVYVPAAVAV
jgi:phage gp46-like protein